MLLPARSAPHAAARSPPTRRLAALLRACAQVADVVVVTATRDGMNLVPYEYVVCRQGPPGEGAEHGRRESMLVVSGGCTGARGRAGAGGVARVVRGARMPARLQPLHAMLYHLHLSTLSLLPLSAFCACAAHTRACAAHAAALSQSLWAARPACLAPSASTPGPWTRCLMQCTRPSRRPLSTGGCGTTSTGSARARQRGPRQQQWAAPARRQCCSMLGSEDGCACGSSSDCARFRMHTSALLGIRAGCQRGF